MGHSRLIAPFPHATTQPHPQLPDEDGHLVHTFAMRVPGPATGQRTAVSQQWNTSVGLPVFTVPELLDFDLPFLPPAALAAAYPGAGGVAPMLPLPSVGAAWNASGVLQLAQVGAIVCGGKRRVRTLGALTQPCPCGRDRTVRGQLFLPWQLRCLLACCDLPTVFAATCMTVVVRMTHCRLLLYSLPAEGPAGGGPAGGAAHGGHRPHTRHVATGAPRQL